MYMITVSLSSTEALPVKKWRENDFVPRDVFRPIRERAWVITSRYIHMLFKYIILEVTVSKSERAPTQFITCSVP